MSGTRNLEGLKTQALTCVEAAYDKGYKAAKQDIVAVGNKSEYKRGLNDAEKAKVRLISAVSNGGLSMDEIIDIFDATDYESVFENFTICEIIERIKEYDERKQQEKLKKVCDDEIHVGDEVYCLDKNHKSIVVGFTNKNLSRCLVMSERGFLAMDIDTLHKTGRAYPIKEMFKKLNESEK